MATCATCKATDLHHEYLELQGLGWRPVLWNPDGSRHRCLFDGSLAVRDRSTPKPRPVAPKPVAPLPAQPTPRRHTIETEAP
jgi:hypothetical protein